MDLTECFNILKEREHNRQISLNIVDYLQSWLHDCYPDVEVNIRRDHDHVKIDIQADIKLSFNRRVLYITRTYDKKIISIPHLITDKLLEYVIGYLKASLKNNTHRMVKTVKTAKTVL